MATLETTRLRLTPVTSDDVPFFAELWQDPETMAHRGTMRSGSRTGRAWIMCVDPRTLRRIAARSAEAGFDAASTRTVGQLLTVLAASKPGGQMLELGTGAGTGTACLLDGMDSAARLTTVEVDPALSAIARAELNDDRVEWVVRDGGEWLSANTATFDLVFADTWPGKFSHLEQALAAVRPGGFYVIDDLLPQENWPDNHQAAVDDLLADLQDRTDWVTAHVDEASGVLICVRT